MPPYLSSYGVSEEIEDQVNKELQSILDDARVRVQTKPDKNIPHTTYLLGTLTESALNEASQDLNVKFIKNMVTGLRCMRDKNDVARTLGEFMRYQIDTALGIVVLPAETKSSVQRVTFTYGSVGLPDPSYYVDNEDYSKVRTMMAYTKLLRKLADVFEVEGLERGVGLETIAAEEILQARQDSETLLRGSELIRKYSAIPWIPMLQAALDWTPSRIETNLFLVFSKGWLTFLNKCFRTLPLDSWRTWLSTNLLLHFLPLLPPPFDDWEFELFGHRLRGQSKKTPQPRLALRLAQEWLQGSLGAAFIKQFVHPDVKKKATELAEEIKHVAMQRAGATEWLDVATRKKAAAKVKSIYLGVAYPAHMDIDRKTHLHPERLVENVLELSKLDFDDELEKANTKLNPTRWDDPVFAVNAYYYNQGNRLILPAGILRWPFFHPNASDGWNFGGIGATIGHEITHAFDNDGKEYDEEGNRNPWWSRAESARYNQKVRALIALYGKTEYFGHHLNGVLTLSENIADLGGLAIALAALKNRLDTNSATKEIRQREICDFFMSYAVSWRTKDKKQKAIQSLFMDVHAPANARVNNIVRQFDDWYECFDVKPGDVLYLPPEHRIRIF
jgi:putative endopeptidase